jgi:hypothetical protein
MVAGCGWQDGAAGACAGRPQRGGGQGHNRGVRTGPGRERALSGIHLTVTKCVLSERFAGHWRKKLIILQFYGSGYEFVGSVFFWASRILMLYFFVRIRISILIFSYFFFTFYLSSLQF